MGGGVHCLDGQHLRVDTVLDSASSVARLRPSGGSPMTAQGDALGCGGNKIAKPQRGGPSVFEGLSVRAAPLGLALERS